jgi:hypothetical protein
LRRAFGSITKEINGKKDFVLEFVPSYQRPKGMEPS